MPYIVVPQEQKSHQITFEDLLDPSFDVYALSYDPTGTITRYVKNINPRYSLERAIEKMKMLIRDFCVKYSHMIDMEDKSVLYHSFKIPKKSGGLRQIDAPNDDLKAALRELKDILERECGGLYHTSAYAYIPKRSTVSALKKHQSNESRWFGKFDFHNFFGSTTLDFVMQQMSVIYPFSDMFHSPETKKYFEKALSLAFLNGGLPQGTPISPFITNVIMIPIDFVLTNELRKDTRKFVYTRYADDILVSSKYDFDINEVKGRILETLKKFNAPYELSENKTRYGSSSGRNWNLGLMLNKDNKITVGYRNKKQYEAMLFNFAMDTIKNVRWALEDVHHMIGLWSYYRGIEPEYFDTLNQCVAKKTGVDPIETAKKVLRS